MRRGTERIGLGFVIPLGKSYTRRILARPIFSQGMPEPEPEPSHWEQQLNELRGIFRESEKSLRKLDLDFQTLKNENRKLREDLDVRKDLRDLRTSVILDASLWAEGFIKETAGEFIQFLLGRDLVKRPEKSFQGSDDLQKIYTAANNLGLEEHVFLQRLRKLYEYRNEHVHCNSWIEMDSRIKECMDLFGRYRNLGKKFYLQYNFLREAEAVKTAFAVQGKKEG